VIHPHTALRFRFVGGGVGVGVVASRRILLFVYDA
jgi:hypothetical protein